MHYLFLTLAIVGELIGTTCLKYSAGFTKLVPTLLTIAAYTVCFFFFSRALNGISLTLPSHMVCAGHYCCHLAFRFLIRRTNYPYGHHGTIIVIVGVVILNLFGAAH